MKLEEVLPAMREGRVAVANGLHCYRFHDGALQWKRIQDARWMTCGSNIVCSPNDNWTLEPEPKVEWPKGSYQWAAEQVPLAARFDQHMRRKSTGCYSFDSAYDMLALDWEVVP